jgi:IS30 family transposase
MLKENKSTREISENIGCSQRTIQRERQRGQIQQLKTNLEYHLVYDADYAQNDYSVKHECKGSGLKIGNDHELCRFIEQEIKAKNSPDVIANTIRKAPGNYRIKLCTKTIYNYLGKGIFLDVSYKDLIYGHYVKKHQEAVNRPSYKNIKGRSIKERPSSVDDRQEQGHWEMDLVIGKKSGSKAVLLTMTERTSRREIIRKLADKTQNSVIQALDVMERQMGRLKFQKTFRTITVDNGSEFLNSSEMERSCLSKKKARTMVYYAHPFSAYERGTNENMNRMIRRFIPKGADINAYSKKEIQQIENWLNNYPRKILDYYTPMEVYKKAA